MTDFYYVSRAHMFLSAIIEQMDMNEHTVAAMMLIKEAIEEQEREKENGTNDN